MLRFAYQARSHTGLVRQNNEDSGFAGPYVQLVADGVGGAAAGEVASATASYVVSAMATHADTRDLVGLLTAAVHESHAQLRDGVALDRARAGMATTLTAVVTYRGQFAIAHIGDSRAYRLHDGRSMRLTRDHTFVQYLVDQGQLAPDDVATHPYRSAVMRSLDAESPPEPDVFPLDLEAGDRLMVCSDGLTDMVDDHEIDRLLRITDSEAAVSALVDAALAAGGRDNVTCLVADVEEGPVLAHHGLLLGAACDPYLIVDPTAVRLAPPA